MSDHRIIFGDAAEVLRTLPEESVDCVFTSPPYWNLRDYGAEGQIGLEATVEEYVERLVEVFVEVRRVLKPAGTVALVLGDSYASGKGTCYNPGGGAFSLGQKQKAADAYPLDRGSVTSLRAHGLKPKDLVGVPWRVAFALQTDGWWLRADIIWAKSVSGAAAQTGWVGSVMPESCCDRPTSAHEYVFLLAKAQDYWWDKWAVAEPGVFPAGTRAAKGSNRRAGVPGVNARPSEYAVYNGVRNLRDVWTLSAKGTDLGHYAAYPVELPLMGLPAMCPPRVCPHCGKPWVHLVEKTAEFAVTHKGSRFDCGKTGARDGGDRTQAGERFGKRDLGYFPDCIHYGMDNPVLQVQTLLRQAQHGVDVAAELDECVALRDAIPADCWQPGTVLDPFLGSGTTTEAARRLGVNSVGIELNADYEKVMRQRLGQLHTLEGSVHFETACIVKEES